MDPARQGGRNHSTRTPTQCAIDLLARREHSRKELGRKLAARGIDAEEAETVIGRLAEQGWQDDARFAESIARVRADAGYGPLHIRAELNAHGIHPEIIQAALESRADDWSANARRLLARRFPGALHNDAKQRRKAIDFLLRRGFGSSTAFAAAGSATNGDA